MTNSPPVAVEPLDLSVVLINWNALDLTSAALASIREHTTGITYEVFVIDNGSTKDASVAELPRRFPWVTLVANPMNLGFTKATNQGVRQCRGRYVLLLNNDTLQTENALGEAVRYLDAQLDVGALGILHRNHDAARSFQPSFYPFPRPLNDILGVLGLGRATFTPRPDEQDVDWVCGSFLLIRRACLEKVGLLDERYFSYDEDIDWCFQARRAGWKVRFWPGVSMIHLGNAAAPFMRDKILVMFRSHLTYLRKNHSVTAAVAFYLAMGARLGMAVAKTTLLWTVHRVGWTEVQQKWNRLTSFALLRPGHMGG